ncbi:MAG TPA: AAA family ATPase [bacterium]|nr:AAA family ATPase [bacterium]
MRLINLKSSFFKGFYECGNEISFDSSLVIFVGQNGSGKTTIAEAIEWLIYGTTGRRKRRDVDEVEFRGAMRNVLCPSGEDPFVEAEIELKDRSRKRLRRTLHIQGTDEKSTLTLDGTELRNLAPIGISETEYFNPIIVQENLQRLIMSTGQERRDFISRLLGLESLLSFERALDSSCDRFLNSLPIEIRGQYASFQRLKGLIIDIEALAPLASRWNHDQVSFSQDWNEILSQYQNEFGMLSASEEELRGHINLRLGEAKRRIFDLTPYCPKHDIENLIKDLNHNVTSMLEAFDELRGAIIGYAEIISRSYQQLKSALDPEKLNFWKNGLDLIDTASIKEGKTKECPFCEEPTITLQKYEQIKGRLEQSAKYTEAREELQRAITNCKRFINGIFASAKSCLPSQLEEAERERLLTLIPAREQELDTFSGRLRETHLPYKSLSEQIQSASDIIDSILSLTDEPEKRYTIIEFVNTTPSTLSSLVVRYQEKLREHTLAAKHFEEVLQPALSSNEAVHQLEVTKEILSHRRSVLVAFNVLQTLEQLKTARQAVRAYLDEEHRARIQERGNDICSWFNALYGDRGHVKFDSVIPSGQVMRLMANILGKQCHASTHFSQSQMNCLGLALHITSATAEGCPFGFILFDDPIPAFDDEHRESFLGPVINKLLDECEKQIIVLTHLRNVADRLKYANERRKPIFHRIREFSDKGIEVNPYNELRSRCQWIRQNAGGDEIKRDVACQRMRSLIEHLIRAIYQAKTGKLVPLEYESRTGEDLLILLEKLPGFPRPDIDYLRESLSFGCKPSHDDPEWSCPDNTVISQRMNRLEQICRNNGLNV